MKKFFNILQEWKLPVTMGSGILGYFLLESLPFLPAEHEEIYFMLSQKVQPMLIFMMLFLSFLKIAPNEMQPHLWQAEVMLTQVVLFMVTAWIATTMNGERKLLVESAMLCCICPTATAAPVIVGKLGGDVAGNVTYLILINLLVSLVAPAVFTWVVPHEGMTFFTSFQIIMKKVFPLLIFPLLLAWGVRYLLPALCKRLLKYPDLPFCIWLIALPIALLTTTHSVMRSDLRLASMLKLALVALGCCLFQFGLGKRIGKHYGEETSITTGQSLGQKNTIMAMWMGLVFLNPITAVAGGFYCLWHNSINALQLHYSARQKKKTNET